MDCLQNLVLLLVADRDIPRVSQAAGRVVDRAAQDRVARDRAADRGAGKAVGRKAEDKAAGSIADSRTNSGNAASKGSDH